MPVYKLVLSKQVPGFVTIINQLVGGGRGDNTQLLLKSNKTGPQRQQKDYEKKKSDT